MLQLSLTEEQAMLHEMLVRFARERCDPETRLANLRAEPPRRMALWGSLCELGVPAALVSPDAGGFGGSALDVAAVQDALAGALLVEPLLISAGLCAPLLHAASRDTEQVISGAEVYALAHQDGFDPFDAPRLRATPGREGYVLKGRKPAVRHADVATRLLVSASSPDGVLLFDIPRDTAGLTATPSRLLDGAGAADLTFDNLVVDAPARLDLAADEALQETVLRGLTALAVEAAALARATNAETFSYLDVRRQFGAKLSSFQALQHKAADMVIAAEEMSAQARASVIALDEERTAERVRRIVTASLVCDAGGRNVGHTAVQLFGGMGVSDETPVSHHARRYAAMRAQFGTTDARAALLAKMEGYSHG